ncbi:MAG: LamG domain-containing protein, partial [Sedimentisphaerales bacterium]|nr:LamG domain-containing protein [Sedimentisphaerales bacterium]
MFKKAVFILLAFTFALAAPAHATTIMWISDAFDDDTNTIVDDKGFVDLLRANGYTVDYRGESMNTSAPDYRYWRGLSSAKIAELNAADLIIVSRCIDSGQYDDGTEPTQWNGITAPLLLQPAHLYRSGSSIRWSWLNTTNTTNTTDNLLAVLPAHPIFNGVTLSPANEVSVVNVTTSVGDGTVDPTNNYTLIGVRATAGADGVWIASWEQGVEFFPGSGQYAGGPRLYLACGAQETAGSIGRGLYNLTAEGQKIYLNAVEYLLAFNRRASSPTPMNGASVPPEDEVEGGVYMILRFEPGDGATAHTAYFSSNRDDVEGRLGDVSLGSPPFPLYFPTSYYVGLNDANLPAFARQPLQTGVTYYWAVDESDGVDTYPGSVWSFIIIPEHAWDPTPPDDAQNVISDPNVTLSWRLGSADTTGKKVSYDVYYGTDEAAVAAATTPNAHVPNTTLNIGPLNGDQDYYWKVNTVLTPLNPPFIDTIVEGPVWHFKTLLSVSEIDPNLVAWWKLDGGFGDLVFDWSGHANHGTRMGDPQDVPGHEDGAFDFDGNDYVELPTGMGSSGRGSVVMWIKTAQTGSVGMIFYATSENGNGYGTQDEFHVGIEDTARPDTPGGVTFFIMGDTTEIALNSRAVNDDEWHHVAATWDSLGNATLYTDGDSISSPHTANIFNFSAYIRLGRPEANERYYNGLLDDVRLYDIVLSETDVKILAGRLGASSPNPAIGATGVSRTP